MLKWLRDLLFLLWAFILNALAYFAEHQQNLSSHVQPTTFLLFTLLDAPVTFSPIQRAIVAAWFVCILFTAVQALRFAPTGWRRRTDRPPGLDRRPEL